MFYSLTGTVVAVEDGMVALSCGGVAFKCYTSFFTLQRIGSVGTQTTLYTHMNVREDALDLFGFESKEELSCFKLLIGVNGVGPKAALAVLSELSPDRLALCVASSDAKQIQKAQGVGAKLAQRIVLELKDRLAKSTGISSQFSEIGSVGQISQSTGSEEAVSALEVLGYTRADATAAVAKTEETWSVEEKIKFALKLLAGR